MKQFKIMLAVAISLALCSTVWASVTTGMSDEETAEITDTVFASPTCLRGDVNGNGNVALSDVIYLVNVIFKGWPAPVPSTKGDLNCQTGTTLADVIFLVNYLFARGPAPCIPLEVLAVEATSPHLADGLDSAQIWVTASDSCGNPVTNAGIRLVAFSGLSILGEIPLTNNSDGTYVGRYATSLADSVEYRVFDTLSLEQAYSYSDFMPRPVPEDTALLGESEVALPFPSLPDRWVEVPGYGRTKLPLAATQFEDKVFVFAVGVEGRVWFQAYDHELRKWLSDVWTKVPANPSGELYTEYAVAATSTSDKLYVFAVEKSSKRIYVNKKSLGTGPTDGWSTWYQIYPGTTNASVAAVTDDNDEVYVFLKGGGDGKIYHSKTYTDISGYENWTRWAPVIGLGLTTSKAPAAVNHEGYGLHLILQDKGKNLYVFPFAEGEVFETCKVRGTKTSDRFGFAAATDWNNLYVIATDDDTKIRTQIWGDKCNVWSGPAELKGVGKTDKGPAVAKVGGSLSMVFVKGIKTPGIYYHFFSPDNAISEVTTRGHFSTCWDCGGDLKSGHNKYDYDVAGTIPGWTPGTACPSELAIVVHGWDNKMWEGQFKGQRARGSLRDLGYKGPIIVYSWDSDTRFVCSGVKWPKWCGFDAGKWNGQANGPKLAKFLDDYKCRCRSTKIHLMAHSMGPHVVLETIYSLANDGSYKWNNELAGTLIDDVHLLGAVVDNEDIQTNERYGQPIEREVFSMYNYYNPGDDEISAGYWAEERNMALGEQGIENWDFRPRLPIEFEDRDVHPANGDDHYAYWGFLGPTWGDGSAKNPKVMVLVYPRFRK